MVVDVECGGAGVVDTGWRESELVEVIMFLRGKARALVLSSVCGPAHATRQSIYRESEKERERNVAPLLSRIVLYIRATAR